MCSRLWNAPDPEELIRARGVEGLLEDHLDGAIKMFPPNLQQAALAVLVQLITASGTRNVVAVEDLVRRAHDDQPDVAPDLLEAAVERLDTESGLIRRERRHDIELCELTSEFLIPRISVKRDELQRDARATAGPAAAAHPGGDRAGGGGRGGGRRGAHRERGPRSGTRRASSGPWRPSRRQTRGYLGLASRAQALVSVRPDVSALLALAAYLRAPRSVSDALAVSGLTSALEQISLSGSAGILHGHQDTVTSVAFDPGKPNVLASGSGDGTIRLWDTRRHRQLGSPLDGSRAGVSAISFAPNGRMLAAGQGDGTLRVWDVAGSRPVAVDSLNVGGDVIGAAFSPDGRRLAAASLNGVIDVWNVVGWPPGRPSDAARTARWFGTWRLRRTRARSRRSGSDGSIRLWDSSTAKLAAPLRAGPHSAVRRRLPPGRRRARGRRAERAGLAVELRRRSSSSGRSPGKGCDDPEPGLQRRRRSARAGPIRRLGLGPRPEREDGQRSARSHREWSPAWPSARRATCSRRAAPIGRYGCGISFPTEGSVVLSHPVRTSSARSPSATTAACLPRRRSSRAACSSGIPEPARGCRSCAATARCAAWPLPRATACSRRSAREALAQLWNPITGRRDGSPILQPAEARCTTSRSAQTVTCWRLRASLDSSISGTSRPRKRTTSAGSVGRARVRGRVQPRRQAPGLGRRRSHDPPVEHAHRPVWSARSSATPTRSSAWPSARADPRWRPAAPTTRSACGT